ncbi:MAG TPA: hypothetical protein ACFYD6_00765 [Candidatus Brocadiia bacterium]|nr:hypothetical protein [Planctomycetota bacterium]MBI4007203.1 hypothetical protein [Planctomycetota bacterium]MDO8094244.1 hypothetical protein [Candidatus Brocadiales bacterium]
MSNTFSFLYRSVFFYADFVKVTAVGFGPGGEGQAHIANESISIQELKDFAVIMGLITSDLLK